MPKDLIAVFTGQFEAVYTGKFYAIELDDLLSRCKEANVVCGVIKGYCCNDVGDVKLDSASLRQCIKSFYEAGYWTKEQVLKYYKLEYLLY